MSFLLNTEFCIVLFCIEVFTVAPCIYPTNIQTGENVAYVLEYLFGKKHIHRVTVLYEKPGKTRTVRTLNIGSYKIGGHECS